MTTRKPKSPRVTVTLTNEALEKLGKLAKKLSLRGSKPNVSMTMRLLIDKEKL